MGETRLEDSVKVTWEGRKKELNREASVFIID
jgi:hypothetical protein